MFENIDHIYVINLEHRKDRLEQFNENIKDLDIKDRITIINAIYEPDYGALGCSKSHILTLEKFISSEYKNVIIFEDDFRFKNIDETKQILGLINNFIYDQEYDVIMFSGNPYWEYSVIDSEIPFLKKVIKCRTTSSYLLNKNFASRLLENFKYSCEKLKEDKSNIYEFSLDTYWNILQPQSKWYITEPIIGRQQPGYSDIQYYFTNYNC
jgi:GR25 family glycosyltransferase involved in LPS biosynthesis